MTLARIRGRLAPAVVSAAMGRTAQAGCQIASHSPWLQARFFGAACPRALRLEQAILRREPLDCPAQKEYSEVG